MKRCLAILALAALVAGCEEETPTATEQRVNRFAQYNQKMSRLNAEVQLRNARIGEMQKQLTELSSRLSKSEFANKQLRLRLETVGPAPMERDHFKELAEKRAREIQHLQDQIHAFNARLSTSPPIPTSQPATSQPAEGAEGGQ